MTKKSFHKENKLCRNMLRRSLFVILQKWAFVPSEIVGAARGGAC